MFSRSYPLHPDWWDMLHRCLCPMDKDYQRTWCWCGPHSMLRWPLPMCCYSQSFFGEQWHFTWPTAILLQITTWSLPPIDQARLLWTRSGLMLASCTSMAIASALVELLSFFLQACLQRLWLLLGDRHPLHSSCISITWGNFYLWAPYEPINRMKWTNSPKSSMIFMFMQRFLNLS